MPWMQPFFLQVCLFNNAKRRLSSRISALFLQVFTSLLPQPQRPLRQSRRPWGCCPRNFEYLTIAHRVILYRIAQHRPTLLGICTRVSLSVIQRSSVSFHKRWHNDSTATFATFAKPGISLFLHECLRRLVM